MSIERKYQRKSQREHILLRPDTYIGSTSPITEGVWVLSDNDKDSVNPYNPQRVKKIILEEITYVPGLYQIFDEVIVNAYDHSVNDKTVKDIKVTINEKTGFITVWNDGSGIPIVKHKELGVYIPEMIFGQLLTSTNYDDSQKRVSGGRNGYGAKLTNIFSSEFQVETVDSKRGLKYSQKWKDNMEKKDKPVVKPYKGKSYTAVTFKPDYSKFGIPRLNRDNYKLMERRVYDLSACTRKNVSVTFNNEKIPIKTFDQYVNMYLAEQDKRVYYHDDTNNMLWEMVVAVNDDYPSFMQVSFVNGISTEKGGKHVDYVIEQVVRKLIAYIKRTVKGKNKDVVNKIRYEVVKNRLFLFLKTVIFNPTFSSQTKNELTTQPKDFGREFIVPDKVVEKLAKTSGIVSDILSMTRFKEEAKAIKGKEGKKKSTVRGIPNLEDANWAGGPKSSECTLILTEGMSAKAFAVSGLSVIGRDKYGVFPLKGKLLNVREASRAQLINNQEIINLKQILGLQEKKKYTSPKELRYGHVMCLTDSDDDGSHIKGLVMNLFEYLWPELLNFPDFLVSLATPVRKAFKGSTALTFFTEGEYNSWKNKQSSTELKKWRIKHYKGLGTSTSAEAKEAFKDLKSKEIVYTYNKEKSDHNAILLAFDKSKIAERKKWIKDFNANNVIKSLKSPKNITTLRNVQKRISIKDFINKEFIHFSVEDNIRSIPNIVDGFKPSQRKVLFGCLKRNLTSEMKVFQLAGYIAEHSAYHHGDASLNSTIISMAQNYVGSNNINLLYPAGQFGTRMMGGKDHASPRYIFTKLEPITKIIFNPSDSPLLNYIEDDGLMVEPIYYYPIIPMILVNGAEGIGTGYSTSVPSFNPRDLILALQTMLKASANGKSPKRVKKLMPWYRGFKGSIVQQSKIATTGAKLLQKENETTYVTRGNVIKLEGNRIEITELPIGQWTTPYKEFLESLTDEGIKMKEKERSDKGKVSRVKEGIVKSFTVHHTDKSVKFIVKLKDDVNVNKLVGTGDVYKVFKLERRINTGNMYLFDPSGKLKLYKTPEEILKEFYKVRLAMYKRRYSHLVSVMEKEASIMKAKARFINDVIEKRIKVFREAEDRIVKQLTDKKYPKIDGTYDYLTSMPVKTFSKEKIADIESKLNSKMRDLRALKKKTEKDLWLEDLQTLSNSL